MTDLYEPSSIFKFKINVPDIEVEASSLEEAKEKAAIRLDQLSGSNTGSELLANAELTPNGVYVCSHLKTTSRDETGKWYTKDGMIMRRVQRVWCNDCHSCLVDIVTDL